MIVSINNFTNCFYQMLITKLHWLRDRQRKDGRAGEFWSYAREKLATNMWLKSQVQSQVHWFDNSTLMPVSMELQRSRYAVQYDSMVESYEPPIILDASTLSAMEVA
jgi:hypothetical protein